jgi:hypothetical protein
MGAANQIAYSAYEWWDLIPAIVGGIIGALAGGIPAWLLARRGSKENLARDKEQRTEKELASAFRVFTKLSMIINDLTSTLLQIEEMLLRPVDPDDESPTQRRVSAFAGAESEPTLMFTADDLYVLIAAGEVDYLTDLDLLGRRYAANLRTMHTYAQLKSKLHDLIGESEIIEFGPGDRIFTRIDAKNAAKLRMQARALESVIVPLIDGMRRDTQLGIKLAQQYGPKMKAYFGTRKVPFFDLTELKALFPSLAFDIAESDSEQCTGLRSGS